MTSRVFNHLLGILPAVLVGFAGAAHGISFDDLTNSQSALSTPATGIVSNTVSAATGILGGSRFIRASSNGVSRVSGDVVGTSKQYFHSMDASTTGITDVRWDGNPATSLEPAGLGGLDLTKDGATAMRIVVTASDSAFGQPIRITFRVYDSTDPTGFFKASSGFVDVTSGITTPTQFLVPFSSFTAFGIQGVDFKTIGAIEMIINGTNASSYDMGVSFIGTNGNCVHVPVNNFILDQCGVCNGNNSTCSDCLGVPNGPALPGIACPSGQLGVCAPGTWTGTPPANCSCTPDKTPTTETCDQLDNDCDGFVDEGTFTGPGNVTGTKGGTCTVGVGACSNTGVFNCAANGGIECSVVPKQPGTEICDNIDNNCNGQIDEGFNKGQSCSVGVGACSNTGVNQCAANGQAECSVQPKAPSDEICDNIDNNCNGQTDEGLGKGDSCSVGVGACRNTGTNICTQNGSVTCSASPLAPQAEICDNIDNDCDGLVDEGVFPNGLGGASAKGASCSVGVGQCSNNGVFQCDVSGEVRCSASPRPPQTEICDSVDNDCDGLTDEGTFGIVGGGTGSKGGVCAVGIGACNNTGILNCAVNGGLECSVGPKAPGTEVCDNIDNDCDSVIDEGFDKGSVCTVGVGACQVTGQRICGPSGSATCGASPGVPTTETCDGIDNDCDGAVDEGLDLGASCVVGTGSCSNAGVKACGAGGAVICAASPLPGVAETCDGVDNDCDGVVDNGSPKTGPLLDQCGVCKGDGKSCVDCKGMVNGTAKNDECGVCGGDSKSCVACTDDDQSNILGDLDSGAKEQQIIVRRATSVLRAIPQARGEAKFISQTLTEAQRLQLENWVLSWTLPVIATTCSVSTSVCITSSNNDILAAYRLNNDKLRDLTFTVMERVRSYRRGQKLNSRDQRLNTAATKQHKANLDLSRTVPEVQFSCAGR